MKIANMSAVLTLRDAEVRHRGPQPAFTSVDLDIRPREIVAVVGPSGCGKSSLLRAAAGLLPLSSGHCDVDHSELAIVFQDATLLPWRNVLHNVELLAELRGSDPTSRRTLAIDALERVGLTDAVDKFPNQLSGGMRMRVSLARALTLNPRLFLLDEPFGALDELTRERLQDEFLRLHDSRPFAALFVTHSVPEAVYLADRVICMSPAPGRFLAEFLVPFSRPRDGSVRFAPEFSDTCRRVSEVIRSDKHRGPA